MENAGRTALHAAAVKGDTGATIRLLDSGFDVNAADSRYMTPLMYAAQNQHADLVSLLLARGAEVDAENDLGMTALWLATHEAKQDGSVVRQLRSSGADPYLTCYFGSSPVTEARRPSSHRTMNGFSTADWFRDLPDEVPPPDVDSSTPPNCPRDRFVMGLSGEGEATRWQCPECGIVRLL
jgi:uncharacterized protein